MHKVFAAAVILAIVPAAQAADDFYFGANVARMEDKGDQAPAIHPLALAIKGGVQFSPNFALEGRYGAGFKTGSAVMSGFNVDLKIDYIYGLYAKGMVPLGSATPYALVGYSKGKETATIKAFGISESGTGSGASFGLGVDVPVTKSVTANLEWARYIEGTDAAGVGYKISALTLGVALHF
jgi:opacity protein-like surface antigen